jgi:Holliday junction resolvasome RuvABC endonuclease subunit
MLLPGSSQLSGDAADALAVAICHAHHHAARARLDQALEHGRASHEVAG